MKQRLSPTIVRLIKEGEALVGKPTCTDPTPHQARLASMPSEDRREFLRNEWHAARKEFQRINKKELV